MAYPQTYLPISRFRENQGLLFAIVLLWGLVAVCMGLIFISEFGFGDRLSKYYLLPWCIATGAVTAAPSLYLIYKGSFNPFHPLVFPAWSYFFPGFCVGGLLLAAGLSQPYFLSYVQDEPYDLPLTLLYVMLGYAGLTIGFAMPYARRFGAWVGGKMPDWNAADGRIAVAALVLLALGLANNIIAFAQGILGFQKTEEVGAFDGILYLLTLFWLEATFLLWLYIFRTRKHGVGQILIVALLLTTAFTRSAFQGNRGGLIQLLVLIAFAYVLSGRKLTPKHYGFGSILVVAALVGGMIYGTTFRSIKQTQERADMGEYASVVGATFSKLAEQDLGTVIVDGFSALSERMDAVSSLAVVVSNYEALAPYEEVWGINNNIYVDTVTFFIPRVIWPEKPISIEPKLYADLYFNFSENSFTITPMGDLLRNFGPLGVPLGMIVLGLLIRVIYAALIENQAFQYWRTTLFYMLFINISFEGTYSLILPILFKVGIIAVVGLVIVRLFAGSIVKKN